MKTFRLFATMMIVAICAGFTSCSNDDDENNNGYSKKIVSGTYIHTYYEDNSTSDITIEYDAQSRVTKRIDDNSTTKYTYNVDKIVVASKYNSNTDERTYILKNNLIVSEISDDERYEYTYDSDNRLSKRIYTWNKLDGEKESTTDYIWKDGNIVSCIEKDGNMGRNSTTTYTYTDIPFHHLGDYVWIPDEIDTILMAQGYFGKCINNLPATETRNSGNKAEYEYELDKDGNVIKYSYTSGGEFAEKEILHFTWQ